MPNTYEDYAYLVPHVLRAHFLWASSKASTKLGRVHFELDDLMQEGRLGLLEAIRNYDEEHAGHPKFITYAYYCIYWAVYRYIDANLTPLTMRGLRRDLEKNGAHAQARFFRALGCRSFSSFTSASPIWRAEDLIIDQRGQLDLTDNEAHAWEKIQQVFDADELDIVLRRYGGLTYEQLGQYLECSRETARKVTIKILDRIDEYVRTEVMNVE